MFMCANATTDAIAASVERVLPHITFWPPLFAHVGSVKHFVANRCPEVNGMVFEGVENSTFRGYVLFHTARVAWEARAFEMGVVPRGWKRTAVEVQVKVSRTLRGSSPLFVPYPTPSTSLSNMIHILDLDLGSLTLTQIQKPSTSTSTP
jgi:hypothetical protein